MFETTTTATALPIQDQETGTNHNAPRETRAVPARRAALGGNYVAAFGRPRSGMQHAAAVRPGTVRPAAGCGYTARYDGAGHRHSAAAVDSYTASFGAADTPARTVTGERGRYTDVNL